MYVFLKNDIFYSFLVKLHIFYKPVTKICLHFAQFMNELSKKNVNAVNKMNVQFLPLKLRDA